MSDDHPSTVTAVGGVKVERVLEQIRARGTCHVSFGDSSGFWVSCQVLARMLSKPYDAVSRCLDILVEQNLVRKRPESAFYQPVMDTAPPPERESVL